MFFFSRFVIHGHSMEPTIKNGQTVLVSSIPYLFSKPKIGDIVAFGKEGRVFIKRIARIENGKYFMRGDNSRDSIDSRQIGWIGKKEIVGRVIYYLS
ncbi:MAG: S26 family signal peptidase [Patescibacteria group bacterium]